MNINFPYFLKYYNSGTQWQHFEQDNLMTTVLEAADILGSTLQGIWGRRNYLI